MDIPVYIDKPTKLHKLYNLSKLLNVNLYIKRDDQSKYLCNGGNKCRKLEYIVQDLRKHSCDTIITCGAIQSNHCMLTASAAAKEGLECWIVLEERVKNSFVEDATGNNFLYDLLGSKKILVEKGSTVKFMEILKKRLEKRGKKPYIVPGGGSYPIGSQGYIDCAKEIIDYSRNNNIKFDYVFVCSGSGGTHTGLLIGFKLYNYDTKVIGVSNNLSKNKQTERIYKHIQNSIKYFKYDIIIKKEDIIVVDDYVGEGYSKPTKGMINVIKLFAQKEGILLDTVYTGKCADGLVDLSKNEEFQDKNLLFVHTGGATSLFHYKTTMLKE